MESVFLEAAVIETDPMARQPKSPFHLGEILWSFLSLGELHEWPLPKSPVGPEHD
jgi:hypothetical protein